MRRTHRRQRGHPLPGIDRRSTRAVTGKRVCRGAVEHRYMGKGASGQQRQSLCIMVGEQQHDKRRFADMGGHAKQTIWHANQRGDFH